MDHILTNAKQTATWDGSKFTVSGSASSAAHSTIKTALGRAYDKATGLSTGVSDGEVGWFRAQYVDQQYLTHYAIFKGTYADSDDSITAVAGTIVDSSSGTSMPDFDQDDGVLFIYGCTPSEAVIDSLPAFSIDESGSYSTTTSTSYTTIGDDIVLTPNSDDVELFINVSIAVSFTGTSGTYARGNVALYSVEGGGDTEVLIQEALLGVRTDTYATPESHNEKTIFDVLTQSQVDSSGDWRLRIKAKSSVAAVTTDVTQVKAMLNQSKR